MHTFRWSPRVVLTLRSFFTVYLSIFICIYFYVSFLIYFALSGAMRLFRRGLGVFFVFANSNAPTTRLPRLHFAFPCFLMGRKLHFLGISFFNLLSILFNLFPLYFVLLYASHCLLRAMLRWERARNFCDGKGRDGTGRAGEIGIECSCCCIEGIALLRWYSGPAYFFWGFSFFFVGSLDWGFGLDWICIGVVGGHWDGMGSVSISTIW